MRGHEHIIALRLKRLIPEAIFIDDYSFTSPNIDWHEHGEFPHVCVKGDSIETLDLRFLIGTQVHISTESESRGKALLKACKKHGATTVIACQTVQTGPEKFETKWMEHYYG